LRSRFHSPLAPPHHKLRILGLEIDQLSAHSGAFQAAWIEEIGQVNRFFAGDRVAVGCTVGKEIGVGGRRVGDGVDGGEGVDVGASIFGVSAWAKPGISGQAIPPAAKPASINAGSFSGIS
jgi:hypothetical protein